MQCWLAKNIIGGVDLSQSQLIILYGLIVIPIAVSLLFMRKGSKPPVQLEFKSDISSASPAKQVAKADRRPDPRPASPPPPRQERRSDEPRVETSLNVHFNWNGFMWDAYEVLGIPAGSSREAAAQALQKAKAQSDAESMPFYEAAYKAIAENRGGRG